MLRNVNYADLIFSHCW